MRRTTLQDLAVFADMIGCALIKRDGLLHVYIKVGTDPSRRYMKWEEFIGYYNKGICSERSGLWLGVIGSYNRMALSLPRVPVPNHIANLMRKA